MPPQPPREPKCFGGVFDGFERGFKGFEIKGEGVMISRFSYRVGHRCFSKHPQKHPKSFKLRFAMLVKHFLRNVHIFVPELLSGKLSENCPTTKNRKGTNPTFKSVK